MATLPLVESIQKGFELLAPSEANEQRSVAMKRFLEIGIPTTRHEEWKYTNVMLLAGLSYDVQPARSHSSTTSSQVDIPFADALRIEVRNGVVSLLDDGNLPDGIRVTKNVSDSIVDENCEHLANHAFAMATQALATDVILIDVDDNAKIEVPVVVTFVTDVHAANSISTGRVFVRVGKNASVHVVEQHRTNGENKALDLSLMSFLVGEGATASCVKVINDTSSLQHIGQTIATVERTGTFSSHAMNLNAGFVRNDVHVRLVGQGSQAFLYGVSVLDNSEYVDNHTVVDHVVPHCHSEELYKGMYNGSSTGVFNGKIYVRPQAQKTTAYQSSRALLLSGKAQLNAKPQLEIWADDVKCSHGATTGQLDDDAVFYLQARGIERAQAISLLTYAFAHEVIDHLPHEELKQSVASVVRKKLGAEALLA